MASRVSLSYPTAHKTNQKSSAANSQKKLPDQSNVIFFSVGSEDRFGGHFVAPKRFQQSETLQ